MIAYPRLWNRQTANYLSELIEHRFWRPIVRAKYGIHGIGDEYPLMSVIC
jgi:hypothetical protein